MRILSIFLIVAGFFTLGSCTYNSIQAHYEYENKFLFAWNYAQKASTIEQKVEYINQFVELLEKSNLRGKVGAIFFITQSDSFELNLKALKSLQKRLYEIKKMDPNSFQYNTAIQQITAQEQGEASSMLQVFRDTWYIENHLLLFGLYSLMWMILGIVLLVTGILLSDMF